MANEENLRPLDTLCKESAKRIRSKGGKVKAEKVRERMKMREELEMLLAMEFEGGKSHQSAGLAKMVHNFAMTGDMDLFVKIRDSVGEKPKDELHVTGDQTKVERIKIEFVDGTEDEEPEQTILGDEVHQEDE